MTRKRRIIRMALEHGVAHAAHEYGIAEATIEHYLGQITSMSFTVSSSTPQLTKEESVCSE